MKNSYLRCFFLLGLLARVEVSAGVFTGTADCFPNDECAPRPIVSNPTQSARPFAVTHPPGYIGTNASLTFLVCVLSGSERLIEPTKRAIATWNALVPTTQNCSGCKVWEQAPFTVTRAHAETTILHELGHCPLGLEHPDRNWDAADDGIWEDTSFTRSWDAAAPPNGIRVGPDFVRGSLDDTQQAGLGQIPESVHWFRIVDNNPFAIDATVIDEDSFSRSITQNLPSGHSWAANANRVVGERLGIHSTQAVMYGLQVEGEIKISLTADDVNMVKMALTGEDWQAGTGEDYTVGLQYVSSCNDANVIVTLGETDTPATLGQCKTGVDYSFPQSPISARHLTLVPESPGPLIVFLNQNITWDIGEVVFTDGFESGNTTAWSSTVP